MPLTRYPGVRQETPKRYSAAITVHGVRYYLGSWPTVRLAAIAADRCALHIGASRPLNFPKTSRRLGPASAREQVQGSLSAFTPIP